MRNSVPRRPIQSPFGLRFRVIVFSGLPVVVLLSCIGWLVFDQYSTVTFQEKREVSAALLESFAVSSSIAVATQNLEGLDSNMIRMAQAGGRLYGLVHVAMLDHRGKILAQAYARDADGLIMAPPKEVPQKEFYSEAIISQSGVWKRVVMKDNSPLLVVSIPSISGLRWGTLVGYFELEKYEARMATARWILIWVTLLVTLSMALGLLVGLWSMVVRPVRELAKGACAIREGNLKVHVEVSRGDELGELASTFNEMARELDDYTSHLQEKVEERTQELKVKNEELGEVNTRLEEAVEQLDKLARTDRLTGVSNRGHLMELLERELLRSRRTEESFSLLMLDVDHFKNFNDTYGHQTGDVVLVETVRRIEDVLRGTDSLGRYGGEEFVVILPETDNEGAVAVAENIRKAVSKNEYKTSDGDSVGFVTISGGIAVFPHNGQSIHDLIRRADIALYAAKEAGRNRILTTLR